MMTATYTEKLVSRLNVIESVVRRWQGGEIAWSAIQFQADLTDAQMSHLKANIYRSMDRAAVAKVIAGMIGL